MALQGYLDLEEKFIIDDQKLEEILDYWGNVLFHFEERIPPENKDALELNGKIVDEVEKIQFLLKIHGHRDMELHAEEEDILDQLEDTVKSKEWQLIKQKTGRPERLLERLFRAKSRTLQGRERAIFYKLKKVVDKKLWKAEHGAENALRAESKEIRDIHHHFINILKHFKDLKSHLGPALQQELEHYFVQLHNTIQIYERIFRDLWKKERLYVEKLKHH